MPYPRHLLQSFEIPSVTQSRFSGDYHAGSSQWEIGYQAIFAEALGIAPFKDVRTTNAGRRIYNYDVFLDFLYFSSSTDVCRQERRAVSETRSLFGSLLDWSRGARRSLQPHGSGYCHADLVYMLRTGPPSHRAKLAAYRICFSAEDGRILKPTKPMRAINAMFTQAAFGTGGPGHGNVWTTHTKVTTERKN